MGRVAEHSIIKILQPDDVLLFIHIPKTAGTTLISLLDQQFAQDEIFPFHSVSSPDQLCGFQPQQIGNYRFIRGHYQFGPYDDKLYRFIIQNPICMTILRDPVTRTISEYRHYVRNPGPMHDEIVANGTTLMEYVCAPKYYRRVVNRQTRLVLGAVGGFPLRYDDDKALSNEALIRLAKERIEQFAFVGMTERLEESIRLLFYTFGWQLEGVIPSLNISPTPSTWDTVSQEALQAIKERTQLDAELYQFAEKIFKIRLDHMNADIREIGSEVT
jgi:hypothetical protein